MGGKKTKQRESQGDTFLYNIPLMFSGKFSMIHSSKGTSASKYNDSAFCLLLEVCVTSDVLVSVARGKVFRLFSFILASLIFRVVFRCSTIKKLEQGDRPY